MDKRLTDEYKQYGSIQKTSQEIAYDDHVSFPISTMTDRDENMIMTNTQNEHYASSHNRVSCSYNVGECHMSPRSASHVEQSSTLNSATMVNRSMQDPRLKGRKYVFGL